MAVLSYLVPDSRCKAELEKAFPLKSKFSSLCYDIHTSAIHILCTLGKLQHNRLRLT